MVYRITYNVYRLNTVASQKLFQGFSRVRIPLEYIAVIGISKNFDTAMQYNINIIY